jgi:peptidoglycan/LPS O-acetylase OafA/YrhL
MPDLVRYIPCFLPGVIGYKACSLWRRTLPFWGWPVLLFGLYGAFMLEQGRDNGWVICLVTGLAIPLFVEMQNPVLRRFSHVVAKYSYGIYLFHYFSIWLAFVKCHSLPMPGQWLIFAVSLMVLSIGLYHLLEEPMIKVGNRLVESFHPAPAIKGTPEFGESAPVAADIARGVAR